MLWQEKTGAFDMRDEKSNLDPQKSRDYQYLCHQCCSDALKIDGHSLSDMIPKPLTYLDSTAQESCKVTAIWRYWNVVASYFMIVWFLGYCWNFGDWACILLCLLGLVLGGQLFCHFSCFAGSSKRSIEKWQNASFFVTSMLIRKYD